MGKRAFFWSLVLVLLIAFGARVYQLDHQSFWNDEGNSVSLSSRSIQLIIEGTASDVHPPLYYLVLRGWWPLVGQSDFALRYISVTAGVLQVAATVAIGRIWLSRAGALGVGILVALSPPLVYYSQEARMYALLGAVATLSMLVLLKGVSAKERGENGQWTMQHTGSLNTDTDPPTTAYRLPLTVYCLLTTLGLYTHYVYPAVMLAQGFIVLLWAVAQFGFDMRLIWQKSWRWLAAVMVALLVYAPWLPIFLRTGSSTREAGSAGAAEFLTQTAFWLIGGPFARLSVGGPFYPFVALVFAVGLLAVLVVKKRVVFGAALIWMAVPIFLMLVVGATDDNYRKFLTVVVPAVWLFMFLTIEWLGGFLPHRQHIETWAGTLVLLIVPVWGTVDLLQNPENFRDDYRGMVGQIIADNRENPAVILNAPNQWEVVNWYMGDDPNVTLYPLPKSKRPDDQIRQEVTAVIDQHSFVYAAFWGFEGFDPNRTVERTLDELAFKSTDQWMGDVRFVTYGVLGDFLPDETNQPDLEIYEPFYLPELGGASGVRLNWVEASGAEFRPGDVIGLAFEWEAVAEIDGRYKVFIHLLNSDGVLVAQRDAEPVGNLKPTDGWEVGEVVLDQHGVLIPAGLPAGQYTLVMGLYDVRPPNGRLTMQGSDTVTIGEITLK